MCYINDISVTMLYDMNIILLVGSYLKLPRLIIIDVIIY